MLPNSTLQSRHEKAIGGVTCMSCDTLTAEEVGGPRPFLAVAEAHYQVTRDVSLRLLQGCTFLVTFQCQKKGWEVFWRYKEKKTFYRCIAQFSVCFLIYRHATLVIFSIQAAGHFSLLLRECVSFFLFSFFSFAQMALQHDNINLSNIPIFTITWNTSLKSQVSLSSQ